VVVMKTPNGWCVTSTANSFPRRFAVPRSDFHLIALTPTACAFLADPDYLRTHRLTTKVQLIAEAGTAGDPSRAVDGVIPQQGVQWDSPLSVVLTSPTSFIEVTVPDADVNGIFLSVDGSDVYEVQCIRADGRSTSLGTVLAGVPIGMGTGLLFSNELAGCRAVRVMPQSGDGYYSVGEIGFLKR